MVLFQQVLAVMESESSVSKGCFVYKKRKAEKERKDVTKCAKICPLDGAATYRISLFTKIWKRFNRSLEIAKLDRSIDVVADLNIFIKQSTKLFAKESRFSDIPVAVLMTGVNLLDQEAVLSSVMQSEDGSSLVTLLVPEGVSSVKDLIEKLVSTLINNGDKAKLQKYKCTMPVLVSWYKSQKTLLSKKPNSHGSGPSIVVILGKFERFPANVINDFLLVCSEYSSQLPLVLVFGLTSCVEVVQQIIPPRLLSKLAIKVLKSQSPVDYFNVILEKVFLNASFPFKLGSRLYRLLEDNFMHNNFSLDAFISGLKFIVMEYFYSSPLSVLCCDKKAISARIGKLEEATLEQLRQLLSFRKYVESCSRKDQKLLLLDNAHLKSAVGKLLSQLHHYHECFFPVLRLVRFLTDNLPKQPLGTQLSDLYKICLEKDLIATTEFQDALRFLRLMSRKELSKKLRSALLCFEEGDQLPADVLSLKERLEAVVIQLDACVESNDYSRVKYLNSEPRNKEDTESGTALPPKTDGPMSKKSSDMKEEAFSIIEEAVRNLLKCQKSFTLYEVLYFDDVNLCSRVVANQQATIQAAFTDPQRYLDCNCCTLLSIDNVMASLPDNCIIYKLHLEYPRIINLYDWLQAFISVVSPESPTDSETKQLVTRFLCGVAELQLLGFIVKYPRNTNYVIRATL